MVQVSFFCSAWTQQPPPIEVANDKMVNCDEWSPTGEPAMHEEKTLTGKIALVTGGNRGIGLAIARRLGSLGARVAISGRNQAALDSAATQLRSAGIDAGSFAADLKDQAEVRRLAEQVGHALGNPDIVVNNAGLGVFRPVHELGETDWNKMLDTNLRAVFLLIKHFAPAMIQRGSGDIINIGSLAGKNAFAGGSGYCASKWGLMGLTYCAAEDLREYGVRVSVVCPGTVATEFSPHSGKDPSKMLQPEDVAHAVESLVTQSRQSFISEIDIRPARKP
jgi:3-oxoacyl-[acyl-carrier protein] reductase